MFHWIISNQKNRGPMWYIFAIIIIGILVVYGIVSQIYLLSFVAVLFAGVFLLIENNSTPTTEITLTEQNIQINEIVYSWKEFIGFNIFANGNYYVLRLFSNKKMSPIIDLPLTENINAQWLYEFLSNFLPENSHTEASNLDTIINITKL